MTKNILYLNIFLTIVIDILFLLMILINLYDSKLQKLKEFKDSQIKLLELHRNELLLYNERTLNANMVFQENCMKLFTLIQGKNYAAVQDRFSHLFNQAQLKRPCFYTSDTFINAVLTTKIDVIQKNSILFDFENIFLPVTGLPIDFSIDFSTILFNLLDNAINACKSTINPNINVPDTFERKPDQPFIKLELQYRQNILHLHLLNSKSPESVSRETHFYEHGFGLQIIHEIVKKYHGFFLCHDHITSFETNIALNYK